MNPPNCQLSNQVLDDPTNRYCEIYKIINKVNNKIYVGQTVSHVLNAKRYRPYGHIRRFKSHVSEAFSSKKNQCHYLNNAIRKYGTSNFEVELIECCPLEISNEKEIYYIEKYNSLFPNGYNLKNGGNVFTHSDESKKRLSIGVAKYYSDKKMQRFKDIKKIDDDIYKYIRPLKRNNTQYGWYVLINRKKADFGGVHIPIEESLNSAIEFIQEIKNHLARHLDAGNSLEPLLPLCNGNIIEDLG